MKAIKSVVLLGILSAFTLLSLLTAQGEESHFYIKGDLGGNLTSDSQGSIRGDPAFGSIFGTRNIALKARFEPGERAGLACGYQITDWFAAGVRLERQSMRWRASVSMTARLRVCRFCLT